MEHTRLQPIKGASAREKTAFTMKTIKELLAEETQAAEAQAEAQPEPEITEPEAIAPAPQMEEAPVAEIAEPVAAAPKAATLPPIASQPEPEKPVEAKPRSFLGSLIGR